MKENEFYMTTADSIYGMMRKNYIYVTKIRKKTFCYVVISLANWWIVEHEGITKLKIEKIEGRTGVGKLEDSRYFRQLNRKTIILPKEDQD